MTKCPICEAKGINHDEVVEKCLSSPYWVGTLLVGYDWFENDFHKLLADWFVHHVEKGSRKFIIMIPRDHLKTSMFGVCLLLWWALKNPEIRVLYRMANATNAEKTLEVVADLCENSPEIEHYFPSRALRKHDPNLNHKSNANLLRLSREGKFREATIEARGIFSSVTGGHFNVHVNDDLIDETMIDSEATQGKVTGAIKRSDAMFVKANEDYEIHIGTYWPGPHYKWLLGLKDRYTSCILGCYVDDRYRDFLSSMGKTTTLKDGDPIWPEHFDKETLEDIAAKSGPFDFAHQWLNIPMSDEERRFEREDIRYYRLAADRPALIYDAYGESHQIPLANLYRTIAIDPATGEGQDTDETAITVCGYDKKSGNIFVLDAWTKRALPFEVINKVLEFTAKWEPKKILPEDVSYQKTFKHYLRSAMSQAGLRAKIEPIPVGSKKKGTRIMDALQPFVANNQVWFQKAHKDFVDELVGIQVVGGKVVGKSPNFVDSLSFHARNWRVGGKPKPRPAEEDGINFVNPFNEPMPRSYGLACST